jgi:RNA polymerase sigma-70 factor (ECF subfamily)
MTTAITEPISWSGPAQTASLESERARLVRLCAYLTGDSGAAEDLAQEALLEAWRTSDRIHEPADFSAWLNGCTRNVCRRWTAKRGRELAHRSLSNDRRKSETDEIAGDFDLELELERSDLAELLDRALGLLPTDTRDALIQRYIEERSQAEIADRLGFSEGAIAVRIHRGKLALKNALGSGELRPLAESFGLHPGTTDEWRETRIWCPVCGLNRLRGYMGPDGTPLRFRCPLCHQDEGWYAINGNQMGHILRGTKTFKPAYTRCANYVHEHYREPLMAGQAQCLACGATNPIRLGMGPHTPRASRTEHGFHFVCSHCGLAENFSLAAIVLFHPEGMRFQREHPKIRMLPEKHVEIDGVPAIISTYESHSDATRFEMVTIRDTFEVVFLNGQPYR